MSDIYPSEKRSEIMSRISGKDTKPEQLVRKHLFASGFRYRKHDKKLPGTPDIVLAKYKTVIFVHGCFWHGHTCPRGTLPVTNREFWKKKIERTKQRDEENIEALKGAGWQVLIIWQCEISNKKNHYQKMEKVCEEIIEYET